MWSLPNNLNLFSEFQNNSGFNEQPSVIQSFETRLKEIRTSFFKFQKANKLISKLSSNERSLESFSQSGFKIINLSRTANHINKLRVQKESIESRQKIIEELQGKIKLKHVTLNLLDDAFLGASQILLDELEREINLISKFAQYGLSISVRSMNTQINNSRVTESQHGTLGPDFLPINKTKYLHIDGKPTASMKLLIYLNDVGIENGPFRIVDENKYHPSDEELIIRKTNDALSHGEKQLAMLPEKYRARCVFGNDINEKHPEHGFLISHEIAMTGQKGSGILFNNNKIHRGGFVKKGTRHMAQVNFSIGALR